MPPPGSAARGRHGSVERPAELFHCTRRVLVRVQGSVQLDDVSLPQPDIAVLRLRDDYHLERGDRRGRVAAD